MNIRFLQLSDIHFQYTNFRTERLRDKFLEKIAEINNEKRFNNLFITGDISHRGTGYDASVKQFITNTLNQLKLDTDSLNIIPGNHDVRRDAIATYILPTIYSNTVPSDEIDTVPDEVYSQITQSLDNYCDFYREFKGEDYDLNRLHNFSIKEKYNVIEINTAFTCYRDQQEGNLVIGKNKLYKLLKSNENQLKNSNKPNIAIGHHTLDCLSPDDKKYVNNLFEDYKVDMYLAGHVHQPNYFFTLKSNFTPFFELTSGAMYSDEYASPGFIVIDLNLTNFLVEVHFYIWNNQHEYWSKNNQIGRGIENGILKFNLNRLEKVNDSSEDSLMEENEAPMVDEDEFKEFIIDFHNKTPQKTQFTYDASKKIELNDKFIKMRCSSTFEKAFEGYSAYFAPVEEIMNSTAYIQTEKKELVAEVILDQYLSIHNEYDNGDKIFSEITKLISEEYLPLFSSGYSNNKIKLYIKILIAWCIFECNIFNDLKEQHTS